MFSDKSVVLLPSLWTFPTDKSALFSSWDGSTERSTTQLEKSRTLSGNPTIGNSPLGMVRGGGRSSLITLQIPSILKGLKMTGQSFKNGCQNPHAKKALANAHY